MTQVSRRSVIAGLGTVATGLAAGCLSAADEANGDEASSDEPITEEPRVDSPPHEIVIPEPPADPDDEPWNDEYLVENIETEPSLEFTVVERVALREPAIGGQSYDERPEGSDQYHVQLVTDESTLTDLVDDETVADTDLDAVRFDDHVVVLIESGWGSSSKTHQWVRVEERNGEIHLHGGYIDPLVGTTDISTRTSAVIVERAAEVDIARMSLTVDPDNRVHANSTEGVVSIDDLDGASN